MSLELRLWSEEEFEASRDAWQSLHVLSRADPLFMSWDWQWRWWRHYGEVLGATLLLVAGYRSKQLVALAPLYVHRVILRGPFRFTRIEVNGLAWRDSRGFFSEYLDLVALPEHEAGFVDALAAWLGGRGEWDDLVLPVTRRDSALSNLARKMSEGRWYREVDPLAAHRIELPTTWLEYSNRLSSSARRRIVNHRQKLKQPALVLAKPFEAASFLEGLNNYRDRRWGAGDPIGTRFLADYSAAMAAAGNARLSRLEANGETLSYLYTVRRGATEYYLLSGFREKADEGLSPGYLHLGYAIEASIQAGCRIFDLLAGPGRHRDYKTDFETVTTSLACHQIVRTGWLRMLHRIKGGRGS